MSDQNPYSPPQARVDDALRGGGPPATRPHEVQIAFQLILGSAVLAFLVFLVQGVYRGPALISVAVVAVLAGFAFAIRAGHRWARLLFGILYVLGLPTLLLAPQMIATQGWVLFFVFCIQTLLQGAGLWLIARQPGSAWFRKAGPAQPMRGTSGSPSSRP